jgi:uncharacterized membrane protein YjfL (UPF0719 family)
METKLVYLALYQLFGALVLGTLVMFFTFKLIRITIAKRYLIQKDNVAFAIFMSTILFSVGYIVSGAIHPIHSTFRVLSHSFDSTGMLLLEFSKYLLLFVFISMFIALMVNVIGVSLFNALTRKVDELKEISENNVAVGLVSGMMVVVLSLFVQDAVTLLLESMIPYPDMPYIH